MVFEEYGGPEVLTLKDIPKPAPTDDEVLINVHATSVNDWDWSMLRGIPFVNRLSAGLFNPTKIPVLGCDVAGVVEDVGKNIKHLKPGDEVFGDLSRGKWGALAEYVCAPEEALAVKPKSMTFEQAAAFPQAGVLGLQGIRDKGQVQAGQKVLINGASGGAGSFAVQIAKSIGAEVTGVCRTVKMDMVSSIGADFVIDYTKVDFTKNGQHYDLILDMEAYHSISDYRRSLKPNGRYIAEGGPTGNIMKIIYFGMLVSLFSSKKMSLLMLKQNEGLTDLIELFEAGKVEPIIDKCFPLSETADAFRFFGEGHKKGKVVVSLKNI